MPDFSYTARTRAGLIQKDVISAPDERAVAEILRRLNLLPTQITINHPRMNFQDIWAKLQRIKLLDKITFIKNLGVMIRAGLPISKSLRILASQTPNPKFAKVVSEIDRLVESGTSLADAMLKFPKVFSNIFINMVKVGETSGTLDQNLQYLADQMQRDYDLMSKARGALTYPVIILVALGIVGFVMFTFILPKLTATFEDLNVKLPIMTRIVIAVVDIFSHYGIFILIATLGLIIGGLYWRTTEPGKKIVHKFVLYIPIISDIVKKINMARFLRVFSSLIKSGMSIVTSLEICSQVVGNVYYQKTILEASSKVKTGLPLTVTFKKQPKLFSNLVIQMMEVGEESGTTDQVLGEVANFYEQEVDQTMKNLSSILEPLIMMVIGVVVGILAVALITPIYNITQSV